MILWFWLLLLRFLFLDTDPGGTDGDDPLDDGDGSSAGGSPGDGDDDDVEEPDDAEATKNPKARIKSLLQANSRLAKRVREKDKRIAELEAASDDGALEARLAAAFWRHCYSSDMKLTDAETAWELATNKGFFDPVKISDDGDVEGMDEALARLTERYPYLLDDSSDEAPQHTPLPSGPSGRQPLTRSKAIGAKQTNKVKLKERFPALRRRV